LRRRHRRPAPLSYFDASSATASTDAFLPNLHLLRRRLLLRRCLPLPRLLFLVRRPTRLLLLRRLQFMDRREATVRYGFSSSRRPCDSTDSSFHIQRVHAL
ncbi:unnamed protein product, partial [Urochloa humidicola]